MANLLPDHADLYHTGIVMHDLERAKAELSEPGSEPASQTGRRRS